MSMQTLPSQALLKDLRHCLASAISGFKAYDVESVCKRIGLGITESGNPYNSKYKYAMSCIIAEPNEVVLTAARSLLTEETDFNLFEAANKYEEIGQNLISEITRRRIFAIFDDTRICTEIEELDLLRRLWPIDSMPPFYDRYSLEPRTLTDDILQHTVNNDDWSNRELLEHVGALNCSQAQFFRFLAFVTDPLVQTAERQAELVDDVNAHLIHDSYKLVQIQVRSGCPFYEVRPLPSSRPGDDNISKVLEAFDPDEIHARWLSIMESRETNPGRTITLARTLLEDVCKWIIIEAEDNYEEKAELPDLYKQLSKILKLAPDDYTEEIFKQILRGCHSVVQGLGSLRNKLGDAHSLGPRRARPSPRHAELAANLSGAMATFLVSTWLARQEESARSKAI